MSKLESLGADAGIVLGQRVLKKVLEHLLDSAGLDLK